MYFENMGSASSSKIGHDFKKLSGSKIKVGFLKKILQFLTMKIDFKSTISAPFDEP